MNTLMELIRAIRNARAEYEVEPGRRIAAVLVGGAESAMLEEQRDVIIALAHIDSSKLVIAPSLAARPEKALALIVGDVECYLPLADLVDLEREITRLRSEISRQEAELARATKLLSNEGFTARAPQAVVSKEQEKAEAAKSKLTKLEERLAALNS